MQKRTLVCVLTLITCLTAWGVAEPTTTQAQEVEKITLSDASIASESVVYNAATGTFLVGSVANGTIYEVAQDGTVTPFIQDAGLTASVGMYIDAANSKLYVVNASMGQILLGLTRRGSFGGGQPPAGGMQPGGQPPQGDNSGTPGGQPPTGDTGTPGGQPPNMGQMDSSIALFVFDLNTKQQISKIDLTNVATQQGLRLAYDVTLDKDGNAYVTDSFAGAIYRIDPQGTVAYMSDTKFQNQNAMMMGGPAQGGAPPQGGSTPEQGAGAPAQGDRGMMGGGGLGLTGIAYHADGYLIVANSSEGKLLKVPLDNPQNVTEITLTAAITGVRDIQLTADGKLIVTSSDQPSVFVLTSADQWTTATVEKQIAVENNASAIALKADEVWALETSAVAPPAQDGTAQTAPESTLTLQRLALN